MRDAACMRLATSRGAGTGEGMRRLCPSTSLKPDPGLRIPPCRCPPRASNPPPPHLLSLLGSLSSVPLSMRLAPFSRSPTVRRARSFDYCFVKCNVKDSTITPICPAAIVPAIKAVVLALVRHCSLARSLPRFLPFSIRPFVHPSSNCNEHPPPLAARCFFPLLSLSLSFSPLLSRVSRGRRGECSLRKFKFIPGSRSLEERIKGSGREAREEARVAT